MKLLNKNERIWTMLLTEKGWNYKKNEIEWKVVVLLFIKLGIVIYWEYYVKHRDKHTARIGETFLGLPPLLNLFKILQIRPKVTSNS